MEKEQHICPVCGYPDLEEPPYNEFGEPTYVICSCCGFEFGFDDSSEGYTFKKYRQEWIENGFKFFSKNKSANWSKRTMLAQLENVKSTSWEPRF